MRYSIYRKIMNPEPTMWSTIFAIIISLIVMGGFIFFLCLLNTLIKFGHKAGKKFIMFPYF